MSWSIIEGDCRAVVPTFENETFDAIVTDPPYEIGFMNCPWDKRGVSFDPKTWQVLLAALKPGGHMLVFGGARTFRRIAVAIEDAGFEIRDCLCWLYGQGMPISLDVSKAIDKRLGAERPVVGYWKPTGTGRPKVGGGHAAKATTAALESYERLDVVLPITAPASEQAQRWDGWGTGLKPSWEPIILARKPLAGTVAHNVLEYGTGAINILGCRMAGGRWPANVALDDEAARMVDAQSGERPTSRTDTPFKRRSRVPDDTGGASRFFYVAKASRKEREAGLADEPLQTLAMSNGEQTHEDGYDKAQSIGYNRVRKVHNHHPTVKPVALMRWLVRMVTPPRGHVLDPFAGSGSTGIACLLEGFHFTGIEIEPTYVQLANARLRYAEHHKDAWER